LNGRILQFIILQDVLFACWSCLYAMLVYSFSVCLSVCLSVRPFACLSVSRFIPQSTWIMYLE